MYAIRSYYVTEGGGNPAVQPEAGGGAHHQNIPGPILPFVSFGIPALYVGNVFLNDPRTSLGMGGQTDIVPNFRCNNQILPLYSWGGAPKMQSHSASAVV